LVSSLNNLLVHLLFHNSANLQKILEGDLDQRQLYVRCLNFLAVLCSEEGKLRTKEGSDGSDADKPVSITSLLNQPLHTGELLVLPSITCAHHF